jgi:hypothetical protein
MPSEESMGQAGAELLAQRLSGVRNQKWLAELLDRVRLEEAEWWEHLAPDCGMPPSGSPECMYCQRLAKLRAGK